MNPENAEIECKNSEYLKKDKQDTSCEYKNPVTGVKSGPTNLRFTYYFKAEEKQSQEKYEYRCNCHERSECDYSNAGWWEGAGTPSCPSVVCDTCSGTKTVTYYVCPEGKLYGQNCYIY